MLKLKLKREDRLKKALKKRKSPLLAAAYAHVCIKEGLFKKAKRVLSGDDPLQAYLLGRMLEEEGNLKEALETFRSVLEKDPFCLGVHARVVKLASELGVLDEVEESVNMLKGTCLCPILDELPEETVVVEEEEPGEAAEEEEVLVLDETAFLTVEMVKSLFEQCLFEEALEQVKRLLEAEPDNQEALALKEKIEGYLKYLEPEEPEE